MSFFKIIFSILVFCVIGFSTASATQYPYLLDGYYLDGGEGSRIYFGGGYYELQFGFTTNGIASNYIQLYNFLSEKGIDQSVAFSISPYQQVTFNGATLASHLPALGYVVPYLNSYTYPIEFQGDKIYINSIPYCTYFSLGYYRFSGLFPWKTGVPCYNGNDIPAFTDGYVVGATPINITFYKGSTTPPPEEAPVLNTLHGTKEFDKSFINKYRSSGELSSDLTLESAPDIFGMLSGSGIQKIELRHANNNNWVDLSQQKLNKILSE